MVAWRFSVVEECHLIAVSVARAVVRLFALDVDRLIAMGFGVIWLRTQRGPFLDWLYLLVGLDDGLHSTSIGSPPLCLASFVGTAVGRDSFVVLI
jgi:hypothetical protein